MAKQLHSDPSSNHTVVTNLSPPPPPPAMLVGRCNQSSSQQHHAFVAILHPAPSVHSLQRGGVQNEATTCRARMAERRRATGAGDSRHDEGATRGGSRPHGSHQS